MIAPVSNSTSGAKGKSLFRTADGKNHAFLFLLITSLFLLWGVCNGMIDVLNKHFQDSLHISRAQSAFVQFANYMGYFFMALPSGLLARRFGYKGAIIIGLALVAVGSLWFIPATRIDTYWAFLLGLFILAVGLTCLETVCNPYTTVLGPPETSAVRINFAQSGNGVGWMVGPVLGGFFVLSATGEANTSNADLYKPYLIVGLVVSLLTLVFIFSKVPDFHAEEECQVPDGTAKATVKPLFKRWHFILAIAAQFFYCAAQTGVFSYFVNYIATDTPVLSQSMAGKLQGGADVLHNVFRLPPARMTYPAAMLSADDVTNLSAFVSKLQNDPDAKTRPLSDYIWSQFSTNQSFLVFPSIVSLADKLNAPASVKELTPDLDKEVERQKTTILLKGLNQLLQTNVLYNIQRFAGVALPDDTAKMAAQNPSGEQLVRLNRSLLEAAYPADDITRSPYLYKPLFHVTDRGASVLLSFGGFALFLLGRFTGSFALRLFKAHMMLAVYAVFNVLMMVLIMFPLGWWSVAGLFLSFFFMSIMYPTIFALGIHGLGEQTKRGASFIVMAIVGGAIMPMFMGWLADQWGMRIGFLMPLICFVFIALYGLAWRKLETKDAA
jgi:FHS family L-fucose permease-like MFS transporter